MGLPVRQRRVLERIEITLHGSDPKLAALYAIFSRLTRDEEMPRIEQLRHSAVRFLAWLRLRPVAAGVGRGSRLGPRQRAVLFFPVAIALAVASIVFAARVSTSYSCAPVRAVAAARSVAKSKLCRPPASLSPLFAH